MNSKKEKELRKDGEIEIDNDEKIDESKKTDPSEKKGVQNEMPGTSASSEPKKKDFKDADDRFGVKDNIGDPGSPDGAIGLTINRMNLLSAVVKAEEISTINRQNLRAGLQADLLVQGPLNGWSDSGVLSGYDSYKIVDEIPSLFKVRVTKLPMVTSMVDPDPQGWSHYTFVNDSITAFSGNLELVDYVIDSNATFEKISYVDDQIPRTTLHLENYQVSIQNQPGIENHNDRTSLMTGLLELIFKTRRSGDVFVKGSRIETYGSMSISDSPTSTLVGIKLVAGGQPSVFIGVTSHELQWFRDSVENAIPADSMTIGETSVVAHQIGKPVKIYSYYAVCTDALIATLHHIFMKKFFHYRLRTHQFTTLVEIFSPLGGSVELTYADTNVDLFFVMGLSRTMIDQYRFMFILSAQFRKHVISTIVSLAISMEGLTVVPTIDVADVFETTAVNTNNTTIFQNQLSIMIRPLTINHFYEAMGLEIFHAFLSPSNPRKSGFASYQDAALNLLAIGLDAIIFPASFWGNIGLFTKAIYDALRILDFASYERLMTKGYTADHPMPVDLRKDEVLAGQIPFIYTNPPAGRISSFMDAIQPRGTLIPLPNGNSEISTSLNSDPQFYIPWSWESRRSFGTITDTQLSDAVTSLARVINAFILRHKVDKGLSNAEVGAITTLIDQITIERGKTMGSVLHAEGHLIMRQLANMPWLMHSTYTGERAPNLANYIGIYQTASPNEIGFPCNDEAVQYPHGIGLWTLLNINSSQIAKAGPVDSNGSVSLVIPDPLVLYNKFVNDVTHCVEFAEAYGYMSMILLAQEREDPEYAFLLQVLGRNLKTGVVAQVLDWMLPRGSEPIITYLNSVSLTVRRPDQRLRDPGIAHLDYTGRRVVPNRHDGDVFRRKLNLIDPYEMQKFKVACTFIGDSASPVHKIGKGLTFSHETFTNLSPDNRHSEVDIIIEYDPKAFPIRITGDVSIIGFYYEGVLYTDIKSPEFPCDVRLVIIVPGKLGRARWDFLKLLIMNKGWQLFFPDQLFIARINYVTSSAASLRGDMFDFYWRLLSTSLYGSVLMVEFRDTTSDYVNPAIVVTPSVYDQYVCAIDSVRRNVLLRNAYSLRQPLNYVPPSLVNWEYGKTVPGNIPTDSNGRYKYKSNEVNFNNPILVFTNNVEIGKFPDITYNPPLIQEIFMRS